MKPKCKSTCLRAFGREWTGLWLRHSTLDQSMKSTRSTWQRNRQGDEESMIINPKTEFPIAKTRIDKHERSTVGSDFPPEKWEEEGLGSKNVLPDSSESRRRIRRTWRKNLSVKGELRGFTTGCVWGKMDESREEEIEIRRRSKLSSLSLSLSLAFPGEN